MLECTTQLNISWCETQGLVVQLELAAEEAVGNLLQDLLCLLSWLFRLLALPSGLDTSLKGSDGTLSCKEHGVDEALVHLLDEESDRTCDLLANSALGVGVSTQLLVLLACGLELGLAVGREALQDRVDDEVLQCLGVLVVGTLEVAARDEGHDFACASSDELAVLEDALYDGVAVRASLLDVALVAVDVLAACLQIRLLWVHVRLLRLAHGQGNEAGATNLLQLATDTLDKDVARQVVDLSEHGYLLLHLRDVIRQVHAGPANCV